MNPINYPLATAKLQAWAESLVFPQAGGMEAGRAGSEIGKHLAGQRIESLVARACCECLAKIAEISAGGSGERQHEMTQDLLRHVQDFKSLLIHFESSLMKKEV